MFTKFYRIFPTTVIGKRQKNLNLPNNLHDLTSFTSQMKLLSLGCEKIASSCMKKKTCSNENCVNSCERTKPYSPPM